MCLNILREMKLNDPLVADMNKDKMMAEWLRMPSSLLRGAVSADLEEKRCSMISKPSWS
jgi:hypothetical protein